MSRSCLLRAWAALALIAAAWGSTCWSTAAAAEAAPLTREGVAQLVLEALPARVARREADVYVAAAEGAGDALENPVLSGLGGVRRNADGSRPLSAQVSLAWPVELGGQRSARSAAARAVASAALLHATSSQQQLLLEALLQYQQVLKDERELGLAEARHTLSQRFHAAAQRRQAAGGVPELDVALAALEEQQDAAARAAAQGARNADLQQLATLLGLPAVAVARAELVPEGDVPPLAQLVTAAAQRGEVLAADGELRAARARAEGARAARWPTLSVLAQYERDDGADIGLLGLQVPLPLLNTNRLEVATSSAEVGVAGAKLMQARAHAEGQARQLHARYLATKAALEALGPSEALATRAVGLATRGYELGESDLTSVLLVRRAALEAQAALLGAQHGHAVVKLELLVTARKPVR